MTLQGKVAIVTGGNSGIGQAIVLALAGAGANVVVDYVSHPDDAAAVVAQVEKLGAKAVAAEADVSTVNGVQTLIDAAVKTFGRLDIMCNNAGMETRTSTLDTTEEEYDLVMRVDLKSAFFGTQRAAKQFIAQGGGGVIINTSSIHEDRPMPGNSPYCLAKGGMRMLARTAGVELGPHGIRVVNIGPGAVFTPIDKAEETPEGLAKLDAYIPLGAMAQPEQIGAIAVFLASEAGSYVTATTVIADGGMMQQIPNM